MEVKFDPYTVHCMVLTTDLWCSIEPAADQPPTAFGAMAMTEIPARLLLGINEASGSTLGVICE
jgi:hypothetical protein